MHKVEVGQALKSGWEIFRKNVWLLIGTILISGVIGYTPQAIQDLNDQGKLTLGIWGVALMIVFLLLNQLTELGLIKITLKLVDGKKAELGDLFSCTKVFWQGLVGALIYGVIVLLGILCLIVPGIILGTRLQFFKYLIVDRGMGPIESLRKSWQITEGQTWKLLGLFGALFLVNLVGVLVLMVGLFVSVPVSLVTVAAVYRKLSLKRAE